jgi:hypothetical protein
VGYLEEEAVVTYTDILRLLDTNQLPMWKNLPAPPIAVRYTQVNPSLITDDIWIKDDARKWLCAKSTSKRI